MSDQTTATAITKHRPLLTKPSHSLLEMVKGDSEGAEHGTSIDGPGKMVETATTPSNRSSAHPLYDDNNVTTVAKELTKKLISEREQRQCSFTQLWNHCCGKSFCEKLGIYCDWIYSNVNATLALLGTSTIVPLFAWYTKVFWQAFVSQFIILLILGLFMRFILRHGVYAARNGADQLDRQLYKQSLMHMEKMLKINTNNEEETKKEAASIKVK